MCIYIYIWYVIIIIINYMHIYILLYIIIRFVREITFDLGDSLTISVKATISDRRFLLWRGNDHDGCIGQPWDYGGFMVFYGVLMGFTLW